MNKKKWYNVVFNPFEDYTERKLLGVGLVFFILAVALSYFGQVEFFGILKIIPRPITLFKSFYTLFLGIGLLSCLLFVYAYLENNKTRFVDCLNVVLISSIVMYFLAAMTLLSPVQEILDRIMDAINSGDMKLTTLQGFDLVLISIFGFLSIFLLVYFFYLIIVGIKLAMNGKKLYQGFLLVILVLIADAASKFLIQLIQ